MNAKELLSQQVWFLFRKSVVVSGQWATKAEVATVIKLSDVFISLMSLVL